MNDENDGLIGEEDAWEIRVLWGNDNLIKMIFNGDFKYFEVCYEKKYEIFNVNKVDDIWSNGLFIFFVDGEHLFEILSEHKIDLHFLIDS